MSDEIRWGVPVVLGLLLAIGLILFAEWLERTK